ncbi:MAG: hypothetical protein E6K75_08095 [Candidatus Eisenbacteria bacterium]|uniref:VWA7 N-terminal domain-containing protein n=1 Tax=Eiseniibacteriota bacterium TaxID=2212470 RepID=A0A538SZ96_UNCEI|nr:MAG: hypothetical protein E6K75_08095 [Candidatus Eisenbacteria bacterium]
MQAPRVSAILPAAFLAAVVLAAVSALAGTASAFDTEPHFDITADVLKSEGFSPNAVQTVQSANFFVDFYDFMDHPKVKPALNAACLQRAAPAMAAAHFQHFDMLDSKYDVARRWDAMLAATDSVAIAKTKRGDILGLMALLGASLHNVQDFYAHSNWVEGGTTGPPLGRGALAKYGDHPTWLSMDRADRESLDVYTRLNRNGVIRWHGQWNSPPDSLNKDQPGRPHYTDAYICAYFASRQWVRLFQTFVNDTATWSKMQRFPKSAFDPSRDWDYSRKISFYGGHWSGNGAPSEVMDAFRPPPGTDPDLLLGAVVGYMGGRCIDKKASALRSEVQSLLSTWGVAPYKGPVNVKLPSAAPQSLQFVQIQVHRIDLTGGHDGLLGMGGGMDYYSRAKIDGQYYWSGLIKGHSTFNFDTLAYGPWTMTKALPINRSNVVMIFELMDLDYFFDDFVDINPKKGDTSLVFTYRTTNGQLHGDVSGSAPFTIEGKGDCDCARVKMDVVRTVGSCLR